MAARSAEVKSYVLPDVKSGAQEVYAHWGMSLSDAVNTFLIKSIELGDPDPVLIRGDVLCHYVHGDLAEKIGRAHV